MAHRFLSLGDVLVRGGLHECPVGPGPLSRKVAARHVSRIRQGCRMVLTAKKVDQRSSSSHQYPARSPSDLAQVATRRQATSVRVDGYRAKATPKGVPRT